MFVGAAARANSAGNLAMPGLLERYMRAAMFRLQQTKVPRSPNRRDALHAPNPQQELRERQGLSRHVVETSPYTAVSLRSNTVMPLLLGGGALFAAWKLARRPGLRPSW